MLQVLARFSLSALVASLPLLYVSLLRPPPAALAGDSAFWFLMSNCVIAAIVAADDAGALFFGSSSKADLPWYHDDDDLSYDVSGGQPEPGVALEDDSHGAVVPLMAYYDVPTSSVNMEGARIHHQEELATSSNSTHHGLQPFLIQGEESNVDEEDHASKSPSIDLNHSLVVQRGQQDELASEPSTDKSKNVMVQGQRAVSSTASSTDEPSVIKDDDALAPEPEEGLVEEEEIPEAWAIAQQSRTPDLQQGKGAGEGTKLRRSATEGSKPAAADDSEYSELSDEELNRRVEEFIARFNREMRRQIEQEAAAGV